MKTIEKRDDLIDGDLVEFDGRLFMAKSYNIMLPCRAECDMNGATGRKYCSGFCFRFSNGYRYVFKEAPLPKGDYTIIETNNSVKNNLSHE